MVLLNTKYLTEAVLTSNHDTKGFIRLFIFANSSFPKFCLSSVLILGRSKNDKSFKIKKIIDFVKVLYGNSYEFP